MTFGCSGRNYACLKKLKRYITALWCPLDVTKQLLFFTHYTHKVISIHQQAMNGGLIQLALPLVFFSSMGDYIQKRGALGAWCAGCISRNLNKNVLLLVEEDQVLSVVMWIGVNNYCTVSTFWDRQAIRSFLSFQNLMWYPEFPSENWGIGALNYFSRGAAWTHMKAESLKYIHCFHGNHRV